MYVKIISSCNYVLIQVLRLFFCKKLNFNLNDSGNPGHDTRLLHYLQKDDYFTYSTTIISLIIFGIYYGDYCYYLTIIGIIGKIAIIYLYPHLHIKVVYSFRFWV
jgi:hypothetical protein